MLLSQLLKVFINCSEKYCTATIHSPHMLWVAYNFSKKVSLSIHRKIVKRVGKGLSYGPARLHRLAELIPWNRFSGSLKVLKFVLWARSMLRSLAVQLQNTNKFTLISRIESTWSCSPSCSLTERENHWTWNRPPPTPLLPHGESGDSC